MNEEITKIALVGLVGLDLRELRPVPDKLIQQARPISELPQSKGSSWTEPSDADSSASVSQSSLEEAQ
ncbi:hypothetical protein [Aromatoleum tolulyticum]|uniref:hypothetical protein n=1 Tax=Aromatoleum tolulyticum TaxID=34027 RepID=UPI0011156A37|nr:hypothetical protein [Aromatoleum tolulyticum]